MRDWRGILTAAATLWICAALQQSVAHRLSIFGFAPDFLLAGVACLALFFDRAGAAIVGFFAGVIYGGLVVADLSAYVISFAVGGFAASWSKELHLQGTSLVAAITAAATTVFARLLLMFLAPPALITPFLEATIRTAVYNGVLAVPMYLLFTRIMGPSTRQGRNL